jgi:hypothetical protein
MKKQLSRKQRLPAGWTEKRIRALADYHDNQSIDEQAAEIEDALDRKDQTLMVVPRKLVPQILRLIKKQLTA